jgi:hypothetical protein
VCILVGFIVGFLVAVIALVALVALVTWWDHSGIEETVTAIHARIAPPDRGG